MALKHDLPITLFCIVIERSRSARANLIALLGTMLLVEWYLGALECTLLSTQVTKFTEKTSGHYEDGPVCA